MTTDNQAQPTTKPLDDAAGQAKETYVGFVKAGQDQAAKNFEQTVSAAKEQVEKASAQFLKGYEEIQNFSKGNVDALIASGTIVAKGAEDLGKEVAAYTQASFDKSVATSKAILTARSLKEVLELQNDYAKSSFDSFIEGTTRFQQLSIKLTSEAFAPLNARMNATVEKLSRNASA